MTDQFYRHVAILTTCVVLCASEIALGSEFAEPRSRTYGDLKIGEQASVTSDDFCKSGQEFALKKDSSYRAGNIKRPNVVIMRHLDGVRVTLHTGKGSKDTREAVSRLTDFLLLLAQQPICSSPNVWPVRGVSMEGLYIVNGPDGAEDFIYK